MRRVVLPVAVASLVTLALLAALTTLGPSSPERTRIDVSALGPQVGERVPDFTLRDQHGQEQTLRSLMGPNGLMLVFVRSADW